MWKNLSCMTLVAVAACLGAPYASAQTKATAPAFEADVQTTYTLANGQQLSRQGHVYRNSRGVVREDSGLGAIITDVGAGTVTILVTTTKQAHVMRMPPDLRAPARQTTRPAVEPFDKTIIDGHPVTKARSTGPQGERQEVWTATDLGIVTHSTIEAPGFARTRELKNVSVAEPDPAVFQVPSDYEIIQEPMTFHPGDVGPAPFAV